MKSIVALAVLSFALSRQVAAEETRLLCTGVHSGTERVPSGQTYNPNTGQTEQQYTSVPKQTEVAEEIRFDETTRQFWYKGIAIVGGEKDGDGWIRAKRVSFSEKTIEAEFELNGRGRARNILSFGLAQAMEGKPIGVLDRYSGLWRLLGEKLSCIKVETSERKF